jgi:hypothetical protein
LNPLTPLSDRKAGGLTRAWAFSQRSSYLGPLPVALVCLILAGAADALLRHEAGTSGDERFYERMAAHPGGPHNFPYAYRIGVPWLVHVLPFSHTGSFTAITLLAIAASGGVMYALLSEFAISERLAAGLSIGFAVSPTLLVTLLRHGRSVDPVVVLILTLGCLLIVRRQLLALTVTLLIGATVHESCLFLIPLAYAMWADRLVDFTALREVALVALGPLVLYIIIRTSVNAVAQQYIPGYSGPFFQARVNIIRRGFSDSDLGMELRRLALAYGPLWLAAPFALRDVRFARRGLVLVALCLGAMTFAFGWGRIIFFAAPVFYVAAGTVLQRHRRLAVLAIAVLLSMDLGYAIYMQVYGVQHGIDTTVASSRGVPVY